MNLDLRSPREIRRTRNACRAVVLVVAFLATLLFANLTASAWTNISTHNLNHACGAC